MSTFNEPILTETVAAVAALVTVCLPLLSRVCGKKARREISLLNLLILSMSHILEPTVVDLAVLALASRGPGYPPTQRSVPPVPRQTSGLLLSSTSGVSWSLLRSSSCIFLSEA